MMNKKCSLYICNAVILIAALVYLAHGDCLFPQQNLTNGMTIQTGTLSQDSLEIAPENYLLRFKCFRGYTLIGSRAVLCSGGQWTNKVPKCIRMTCGEPPPIKDGSYKMNTGTSDKPVLSSKAIYSCDNGYKLSNSTIHTLTCAFNEEESSLEWKGEIRECQQKKLCSDPGTSVDGKRTENYKNIFVGNILNYTCNDGFELVGKDSLECLPGGTWSSSRPLCRPLSVHCETPPKILHGEVKGDLEGDFFLPFDYVVVKCDFGYSYTGMSKYIECTEDGQWEAEFQECKEVFCDYPDPLANGTILDIESLNATTFPLKFEITYVCDKGFRLIGDSWRFCKEKGWSGKTPYCQVINCPDPGVPQHGTRLSDGFKIGDKVIFKCFTGYDLIGSFERYCMPNGQWSGELARCDHVNNYCPDPGIPINGMKNSSDYGMGNIIGFQCQPGYTLIGSVVRECLPQRTWSGTEAKCLGPYDFDNSAKVSEILMAAIKDKANEQKQKTKEYREALYSSGHNGSSAQQRSLNLNHPGRLILYFAFDVSGSVGEHNFRKSIEFAKAIVKRIGISEMGARAGALTFSSKAEISFIPVTYTTTEDVLDALDRINYTGGGTSASSAFELILEEMMVLTEAVLSRIGLKSIVFFLTDGKANMGGDPQQKAEKLKEAQVEIYSIGITSDVLQDSLYNIASENEAGSKDDHVFILENFPTLSWLVEKLTNGTIDYSKCGLGLEKVGKESGRGRAVGGQEAPEAWPWMAALYMTDIDLELTLQCGGSIINENYILTAAHCLFHKSGELRKVKEIIVKLGLTNVQNVTNLEEFEVKNIFPHPKFKPGPIFDYDIALLELNRPIEFTALKRPICLPIRPQPNALFYKPGQYAVVIGWGHDAVVQKRQNFNIKHVDHLKQIILPIQSNERCLQSAKENIIINIPVERQFTDRMFCIGDGSGGNDTCKGDSGGPLMQSQIDSEGTTYWTQIGIVSWGFGCGLPNTYGYYTHVQRLESFITDTIQENI